MDFDLSSFFRTMDDAHDCGVSDSELFRQCLVRGTLLVSVDDSLVPQEHLIPMPFPPSSPSLLQRMVMLRGDLQLLDDLGIKRLGQVYANMEARILPSTVTTLVSKFHVRMRFL